jgi:putative Holliday junction resolvase
VAEEKMLELNLPSAVEYLPLVDSLCQAFCSWTGMSKEITDDMAIAAVEAATNAMIHGNKCDKSKKVNISFKRLPRELVILVSDEGTGFQPDSVASPVEGKNIFKENGRGIYIMRHIMDEVTYRFPEAGGTLVRMSKSLARGTGRVLGVDYGERRIGLAISDELQIVAHPFGLVEVERGKDAIGEILSIVSANEVGEIVVGKPLTLRGKASAATSRVTRFVRDLAARSRVAVCAWDERLTTKQSERALIESGMGRQKRKGKVDSVAAALILQSYLDAQKDKRGKSE